MLASVFCPAMDAIKVFTKPCFYFSTKFFFPPSLPGLVAVQGYMSYRYKLSVQQGILTTPKLQQQLAVKGASPDNLNLGLAVFTWEENTFQTLFENLEKNIKYVIKCLLFKSLLPSTSRLDIWVPLGHICLDRITLSVPTVKSVTVLCSSPVRLYMCVCMYPVKLPLPPRLLIML